MACGKIRHESLIFPWKLIKTTGVSVATFDDTGGLEKPTILRYHHIYGQSHFSPQADADAWGKEVKRPEYVNLISLTSKMKKQASNWVSCLDTGWRGMRDLGGFWLMIVPNLGGFDDQ